MKKNEMKEYQDNLMDAAKGTMKLGVVTGIGSYAFGRVGQNHPVVRPVTSSVNAALGLTAVGNLANVGMNIIPGTKNSKKKTKSNEVNKILGL